jgi:hypothetical protein
MIRRSIYRVLTDPWGYRLFCLALFLPMIFGVSWLAQNSFKLFGEVGGFIALAAILGASFWYGYRTSVKDGFSDEEIKADVKNGLIGVLKTPIYAGALLLLASIFTLQPLYNLNPAFGDKLIPPAILLGLCSIIVATIRQRRSLRRTPVRR